MAGNLLQDGSTITTATGTARTTGVLYKLGAAGALGIVGVANDTYTAAEIPTFIVEGVFELTKDAATGSGFTAGDSIYATTGDMTAMNVTAAARQLVGVCWETTTTAATTVKVKLNVGTKIA